LSNFFLNPSTYSLTKSTSYYTNQKTKNKALTDAVVHFLQSFAQTPVIGFAEKGQNYTYALFALAYFLTKENWSSLAEHSDLCGTCFVHHSRLFESFEYKTPSDTGLSSVKSFIIKTVTEWCKTQPDGIAGNFLTSLFQNKALLV